MKSKQLTRAQLLAGIKQHTKAISDARDAIRAIVSDAEEILNDSDDALDELERAIEYLSRNL